MYKMGKSKSSNISTLPRNTAVIKRNNKFKVVASVE